MGRFELNKFLMYQIKACRDLHRSLLQKSLYAEIQTEISITPLKAKISSAFFRLQIVFCVYEKQKTLKILLSNMKNIKCL